MEVRGECLIKRLYINILNIYLEFPYMWSMDTSSGALFGCSLAGELYWGLVDSLWVDLLALVWFD